MQNYLLNRIKWNTFLLLLVMSFNTGHTENLKTEKSQVSPLEELLIAFTTNPTVSLWGDVNKIKSMSWFDKKSQLEKQINQPKDNIKARITKKGRLLLLGFSNNFVPNGKKGAEGGLEERNEGLVDITLNSEFSENPSSLGVSSINIYKYHPTKDHQTLLHNQLSNNFTIKLISNNCEEDVNSTNIGFYQINYLNQQPFYAEIFSDEVEFRWTPGTTSIYFYRQKPTKNMEEFHCIEIY